MTVYVVWRGDYDAYPPVAVCSTFNAAMGIARTVDYGTVATMIIDGPQYDPCDDTAKDIRRMNDYEGNADYPLT